MPTRITTGFGFAVLGVLAAFAFALRVHDLSARPMHTDEAVQAVILGRLVDDSVYRYDPTEYHGPSLHYAARAVAAAAGQRASVELTATVLRLVSVLCGVGLFGWLALWREELGWPAVWWAALFMAISPIQLVFHRYFIHEPLLVLAGFGLITCAMRYLRVPRPGWAVGAGACAGLMHATKSTAVYLWAALLIAVLVLGGFEYLRARRAGRPWSCPLSPAHAGWAVLAAVAVSVLLYSSFFTHPAGVLDSVATYFHFADRATGQGHEKPWFTHLAWIGWTRSGGFVWSEALLLALAAAGVALSRPWKPGTPLFPSLGTPFLGLVAVVWMTLYSLTPYKTPWLMLGPMQLVALLAGSGAAALCAWPRARWAGTLIGLLLLAGSFQLGRQAHRAAFRFAADERVPYVYSHTSRSAVALAERIHRMTAWLEEPERVVQIAGEEYWPLPWYLRDLEKVGYWNTLPERLVAPIIVLDPLLSKAAEGQLMETHVPQWAGMRPGVLVVAWYRKDLWADEIQRRDR
jgi:uncharacterized protein (TIGR03663 family)